MASPWQTFLAALGWISTNTCSAYDAVLVHLGFAVREIITTPRLAAPDNCNVTQFSNLDITLEPFPVVCDSPFTLRRIFGSCPLSPFIDGPFSTSSFLGILVPANTTGLLVWVPPPLKPTFFTKLSDQFSHLRCYLKYSFYSALRDVIQAGWAPYVFLAALLVIVILAFSAVRASRRRLRLHQRWSTLKDYVRTGQSDCWCSFRQVIDAIEHGIAHARVEAIMNTELDREQAQIKRIKHFEKQSEQSLTLANEAEKALNDVVSDAKRLEEGIDVEDNVHKLEQQLVNNEVEIVDLKKDKIKLRGELASLHKENSVLLDQVKDGEQKLCKLSAEKKSMHEAKASLQTKLNAADAREKEWDIEREHVSCLLSDAQADVKRLKSGEAKLKYDVKAKDEEIEKLQLMITTLSTDAMAKNKEIMIMKSRAAQTLRNENEKQAKLAAEIEKQAVHIRQLTAAFESLRNQKETVEAQKNAEITDLVEKIGTLQFDYDKLTDQLSASVSEKQEETTGLQKQNSELNATNN
jgi:chromosome segregation ATPase